MNIYIYIYVLFEKNELKQDREREGEQKRERESERKKRVSVFCWWHPNPLCAFQHMFATRTRHMVIELTVSRVEVGCRLRRVIVHKHETFPAPDEWMVGMANIHIIIHWSKIMDKLYFFNVYRLSIYSEYNYHYND